MKTYQHIILFVFIGLLGKHGIAQIPIPLGTLQPGDTLCIIYDVKIDTNIISEMVSVQCIVTADVIAPVLSDDPDTGTGADATNTTINLEYDFGDAPTGGLIGAPPDSYPTSLAQDGARHVTNDGSNLFLGASVDNDADGQPNATGTGDDTDGNDDEDGVTFTSTIITGNMATVDITASGAGVLNAWMDFNRDGDWEDMDEQIFTDEALSAGLNSLSYSVPVPAGATAGSTFARFRVSPAGGTSYDGVVSGGEVEDYQVNLITNSFSVDDPMVDESGSNLIFTITRNTTTSADSVDIVLSAGTATAGSDYTDNTMGKDTIAFTAGGSTTQTFSVPITDDMIVEADETVTVTLSNPKGGGIADGSGTGTINDDDTATFTIDDVTVNENAGTLDFTVSLDKKIDVAVDIKVDFTDVTAAGGSDFTATQLTASFGANDNADKTVMVPITDDMIVELSETFTAGLSSTTMVGTRTLVMTDTGTGTINDNDTATFTIDDKTVDESAGTMTLTVSLDKKIDVAVDIKVDFTDVTAAGGSDFTATQLTASFGANDNADKTVMVPITDDMIVELSETFTAGLSSTTMVGTRTLVMTDTGTGTINDNDTATFTIDDKTVDESAGTMTLTVSLDKKIDVAVDIKVDFTDVTAAGGSDFTATQLTASFGANDNADKTVMVPITDDMIVELSETFTAGLSSTTMVGTRTLVMTDTGTGTIDDDDTAIFTIDDITVNENAGTLDFTVSLDKEIDIAVDVDVDYTDVTATGGGTDYTSTQLTASFAANDNANKTVMVPITDDMIVELSETFIAALSTATVVGTRTLVMTDTGTGTIDDDDTAIFTIDDMTVNENAGTLDFTVSLDKEIDIAVDVDVDFTDVTATGGGTDYTSTQLTASFGANDNADKTVMVPITDDMIVELSETFTAGLSSTTMVGTRTLVMTDTGTGTINDNDTATFTIDDKTIDESAGTMTLTVSLDKKIDVAVDIKVDFTDVTAAGGSDFTATQLTASFGANDNADKTVMVPITDDMIVELSETFTAGLSSTTMVGTRTLVMTDTGTGTINDDDTATFTIDDVTVNENAGTLDFTVSLDKKIDVAVDIKVDFTDVTAAGGSDFTATQLTASFGANDNADKTVMVPITEDMEVEPSESFTASLSTMTVLGFRSSNLADEGTGTIDDNDMAIVTLSGSTSKLEGNSGTTDYAFTATLDKAVKGGFDIAYTTDDGTATKVDMDYIDNDGSLSFAGSAGETHMITVQSKGDINIEDDEDFTFSLGSFTLTALSSSLATSGSPQTGTILDDDCDLPDIPTLNAPAPICIGSSANILVTAGNLDDAAHWALYTGSCGVTLVTTSPTGDFAVSPVTTTTYFVRGEGNCVPVGTGACKQVTITVIPEPSAADAGMDQLVCDDTMTSLEAIDPAVGTGMWSIESGDGGSFDNAALNNSDFNGVIGETYVLRWTVSNDPCIAVWNEVTIVFESTPVMPGSITGPATICPSIDNIPYSITPIANATSYTWMFSDASATISGDGPSVDLSFDETFTGGTLTVIAHNDCGSSPPQTLIINDGGPDFCQLATCLRENIFVDDQLLATLGAIEIFKASNLIESDAVIEAPSTIVFKSQNGINYYPSFTVEMGATHIAQIEACAATFRENRSRKE